MGKLVFALSFIVGFAILAVAATGQHMNGLEAQATSDMHAGDAHAAIASSHCATREVALDQGYGVSRKIIEKICPVAE
jgi:hypothetical protein